MPNTSIRDVTIQRTSPEGWANSVAYKADAFLRTSEEASFAYEVKRLRAIFDRNVSRFRCPPGTENGGQITNRLGIGCGASVARRIIGNVAEGVQDANRARRRRAARSERREERTSRVTGLLENLEGRTRRYAEEQEALGGTRRRVGREVSRTTDTGNAARRRTATVERATSISRPDTGEVSTPYNRPERRIPGPRVGRADLTDDESERLQRAILDERVTMDVEWGNMLGLNPNEVTPEKVNAFVNTPEAHSLHREWARDYNAIHEAAETGNVDLIDNARVVTRERLWNEAGVYLAWDEDKRRWVDVGDPPAPPGSDRDEFGLDDDEFDAFADAPLVDVDEVAELEALQAAVERAEALQKNRGAATLSKDPKEVADGPWLNLDLIQNHDDILPLAIETQDYRWSLADELVDFARENGSDLDPYDAAGLLDLTEIGEWFYNSVVDEVSVSEESAIRRKVDDVNWLELGAREGNPVKYFNNLSSEARNYLQDRANVRDILTNRRPARGIAGSADDPTPPVDSDVDNYVDFGALSDVETGLLDGAVKDLADSIQGQIADLDLGPNPSPGRVLDEIARLRDAEEITDGEAERLGQVAAIHARLYDRAKHGIEIDSSLFNDLPGATRSNLLREAGVRGVSNPSGRPSSVPSITELFDEDETEAIRTNLKSLMSNARAKRQRLLGNYLKKRYPDPDDAPWKEAPSVDEFSDLIRTIKDEGIDSLDAQDARDQIIALKKAIFEMEFTGLEGQRFRTVLKRVDGINEDNEHGYGDVDFDDPRDVDNWANWVHGEIEAYDKDRGEWRVVGHFDRAWDLDDGPTAENVEMMMGSQSAAARRNGNTTFGDEMKSKGFSTLFNQHAFLWYKQMGFRRVEVSPAYDGPYVWIKSGFQYKFGEDLRHMVTAMEAEVEKHKQAIAAGLLNRGAYADNLIKRSEDAAKIEALIASAKAAGYNPATSPYGAEFILALSGTDGATLLSWFTNRNNNSWSVADYELTDDVVPDDPRDFS